MSSSTLACVGLAAADADELDELIGRALDRAVVMGRPGAVETRRFRDTSGATLTVLRRGERVVDLIPAFAAQIGADLAEIRPFGDYVSADIRQDGVTVGRLACALLQAPYLPRIAVDLTPAAITALGVDVHVYADAAAFLASKASLLRGAGETGARAGQQDGDGDLGEIRYGAESMLPYTLFAEPDDSAPLAFVAGTVLVSETHTNGLTDQVFHVMLVRTAGFTATVCLAGDEHPECPAQDTVVAGTCYLVADVAQLWKVQPKPKRRWRRRR